MSIVGFGAKGAAKVIDVKRNASGSVVMETVASGLQTSVTAAGTGQTTTTPTGNRNTASMSYNITGTGGTIQLLQNGSVMDSVTGLAAGDSGVLDFYTPSPPTSPALTGLASFNGAGTATFTFNANGLRTKPIINGFLNDIWRDVNGSITMETVASGLSTITTVIGTPVTTKTTLTKPGRYFINMKWKNHLGSGADIAFLQNGSVIDSITNQASKATGNLSGSFGSSVQSLTGRFNWGTVTTLVNSFQTAVGMDDSESSFQTLTGVGGTVQVRASVTSVANGYFYVYFLVNGNTFFSTTTIGGNTPTAYIASTTGSFTSPRIGVRCSTENLGTYNLATRTYKLFTPTAKAKGIVTFSGNQKKELKTA